MPQIELPGKAVKFPQARIDAAGFGPLPRWHRERARHAGTYDEKWKRERLPKGWMPEDFDPRFYQAAPPDQICKGYLKGDEPIELEGMTEEGTLSMRLPGFCPVARMVDASGRKETRGLALDTVAIDLDSRQALLTWRRVWPAGEVRQMVLEAVRGRG
jgi:hypothetical protein